MYTFLYHKKNKLEVARAKKSTNIFENQTIDSISIKKQITLIGNIGQPLTNLMTKQELKIVSAINYGTTLNFLHVKMYHKRVARIA